MKQLRKRYGTIFMTSILVFSFMGQLCPDSSACTIAVVSGNATQDGRPILWKNRDTEHFFKNEVKYFTDAELRDGYIGIVNCNDMQDQEETIKVWSGANDEGFAICNAVVFYDEPYDDSSQNGVVMKQALMTCTTVQDFDDLLEDWYGPGISGNFGVIDASGGAAMFEVRTQSDEYAEYNRYDAATFLVMANHNTWGENSDPGFERKDRAIALLTEALPNGISYEFILRDVARDMEDIDPEDVGPFDQFDTNLFISRYRTRSCTVAHGVKPGESPHYTTLWTILGEPAFGVAVPHFPYAHSIPYESEAPFAKMAPMNALTENQELRSYDNNWDDPPYPIDEDIRPYPLYYPESNRPPIQEYAFLIENHTFKVIKTQLDYWRTHRCLVRTTDMRRLEDDTARNIYDCFIQEKFVAW